MIYESTYTAARSVASAIEKHFYEHIKVARDNGEDNLADAPPEKVVEAIIDSAFWASLRREEGHSPRVSLAFLSPAQAGNPILFATRLTLSPTMLTKMGPGFERPGIYLGVWYENDELFVWGATHQIPDFCFVLDVSEPGLLVIKHRRLDGYGKFSNVAILIGDEVKVVDEKSATMPDCPELLTSLLDFTKLNTTVENVNVLLQLAVSMRAHKRGGIMLVVPSEKESWKESIRYPLHYSISPEFSGLADLVRNNKADNTQNEWKTLLTKEVEIIAGLTAIDGAIIINDKYELLAFGEKIRRREGSGLVEQMIITEPIIGGGAMVVHPAMTGGTRHLSAAQFVHDQHESLALVASQDGRFTVFTWSPCERMVHAHRIDSLLL